MKIKSQDLRPGMRVSFQGSNAVTLTRVEKFEERRAPFTGIGKSQAYFPACVLVAWTAFDIITDEPGENTFTFKIDEELERHISEE